MRLPVSYIFIVYNQNGNEALPCARLYSMAFAICAKQRLDEAGVEEIGFGVSEDGCTWALLVRPDHPRWVRLFLEEAVRQAWSIANGMFPNEAVCESLKAQQWPEEFVFLG